MKGKLKGMEVYKVIIVCHGTASACFLPCKYEK